ncbi:MAG: sigma-54-dependent Fis family transcriptional regulator [Bacteroidales bacterium]|jgi:DNA-binding NtrC family response regulator|nr:sigma-54-dependent Fis family transcriptional regulator [Bacteroidales bacterium]
MSYILVIDDEEPIRNALREILEYEKFKVLEAENGIIGLELLKKNKVDVVLCDIKMPQMDGIEVLEKIQETSDIPVVMISGHGNIETAVEAIKRGAFDYISKPLDLNRLLVSVRNALDRHILVSETKKLKQKISKAYDIVGDSEAITNIKEMIERVAPTDARVLITGENGTGKELVARWLHELSGRCGNAFIEVNCAAIPSELIESQLFGHEKGAFTSAIKQRKGDFELANGGTLFLDEIGDMSLSAQAKVLRALQENKITRVGGEKEIPINVRIVAATNKNVREEIAKNNFREDLYHRLSVIIIDVPPLRDRLEDIPLLVEHFSAEISNSQGKPIKQFSNKAYDELKKLPWTGNVRELRNVVERLIILSGKEVTDKDVKEFARPLI